MHDPDDMSAPPTRQAGGGAARGHLTVGPVLPAGPRGAATVVVWYDPPGPQPALRVPGDSVRAVLDAYPRAGLVAFVPAALSLPRIHALVDQATSVMTADQVAVARAAPVTDAIKRIADGSVVTTVERATLRSLTVPAVVKVEWLQTLVSHGGSADLRPLFSTQPGSIAVAGW